MIKKVCMALFLGGFFCATTWATAGVRWLVKVPVNYTVTSHTDFSNNTKRLYVLNGGSTIHHFNLDSSDELVITRDPEVATPRIKICNNSGTTGVWIFYEVNAQGECDGNPNESTEVTLDAGECYEDEQADCAKKTG